MGNYVTLLIADSLANLDASNYTNRGICLVNSSNISITGTHLSEIISINVTMITSANTSWYAKVCNDTGICSCLTENLSWNKTYDGDNLDDEAKSVAIDSDNNVYVAGYGTNLNGSTDQDWWIKKFWGSNGTEDMRWNKTYDNEKLGINDNDNDSINYITTDSNNTVYAVGYGSNLSGDSTYDWWIMCFNENGTRAWNESYSGPTGSDEAHSVAVDNSNNVYIVGQISNIGGYTDWWIKKFNSDGNDVLTNWNKTIDGHNGMFPDIANSVTIDEDDIYIVGFGYNIGGTNNVTDWWIKKFNSDGSEVTTNWNKTIDGNVTPPDHDVAYSVKVDNNHNVYVVGYKTNNDGNKDWWIKKFNSNGNENTTNWNKTIDGNDRDDEAKCVTTDTNNNVYVVGYGSNLMEPLTYNSRADWAIIKYSENGTGVWKETYKTNGGNATAYSISVDNDDNIYVAGSGTKLNGTTTGLDWWIKKFEYISGNITVYPINNTYIDDDFDENTPGWGINHFNKIQEGINNVTAGGNVYVWEGTYYENVELNRLLNLIGNSSDYVIIDGQGLNGNGINITVNNALVQNFTIKNFSNGIRIYSSQNNNITYNKIHNNTNIGIYLTSTATNNNIITNQINDNYVSGIGSLGSQNNRIYNNFFNNSKNVEDTGNNFWNLTTIIEEVNIVGGNYKGGNYWSNYSDIDTNHDGFGDAFPYNNGGNITTGGDYYPLIISPYVITYSPTGNTVPASTNVVITFNKAMNQIKVQNNFTILNTSISNPIWSNDNKTFTFTPTLSYNTNYNISIGWNATDTYGNVMQRNHSWDFTTSAYSGGPGGYTGNNNINNTGNQTRPDDNQTDNNSTTEPDNNQSINNTTSNREVEEIIEIGNLTQGNTTQMNLINASEIGINRVWVTSSINLTNVNISVRRHIEKPLDIIEEPTYNYTKEIYIYLEMNLTSNGSYVKEGDIKSLKIEFSVNKTWMDKWRIINNTRFKINNESIELLRFHNNTWHNFSTIKIGEDTNNFYYETEIPGLSTFAVVGSKVVEKGEAYETDEPEIPWIIIIGFIISAIVILIIVLIKAKYIYIEEVEVPEDKK